MSRRSHWVAVLLILVGFGLRFYGAAMIPLILDESEGTIPLAEEISFRLGQLSLPIHGDLHPAGILYLIKAGTLLFGWTALGARFGNVILGTVALILLYYFARVHLGPRVGLLSLLLIALNPFHIGFSRISTGEQYSCFAFLAMILFWQAVVTRRGIFMIGTGMALGIGSFLKELTIVLMPIFTIYLWWTGSLLAWLKRRSTYLAAGLVFLFLLPDLYFNLTNMIPTRNGFINYGYWLQSLHPFSYNVKPLALYLPTFYFKIQNVEGKIPDEYAFMDHLSGMVILMGVGYAALFHRHNSLVRYLLLIFATVFSFFSFFILPLHGEFWWAGITLFPGVMFGGILLERVSRVRPWRWLVPGGLALWLLWCAIISVTLPTTAFDGSFITPVGEVVSNVKHSFSRFVKHSLSYFGKMWTNPE